MSSNISALTNVLSPRQTFSFQTVSTNEKSNPKSRVLENWINLDEHISVEKQSTFTQANKTYREICFNLSGQAAAYYPLFRSIIASLPSYLHSLQANRKAKCFVLKFDVGMENEISAYLSKAIDLIKAEIRFKQVLRKLIDNQERFNREERLLFNQLSK